MANLIRLTVEKDTAFTTAGSRSLNTANIKKVYANGTGSIVYYSDNSLKAKTVKLEVSESPATINVTLTGTLDFEIPVNVLEINGITTVRTEYIKTSDIVKGIIDSSNTSYSLLTIGDSEYKVNNTLSDIETLVNDFSSGIFSNSRIADFDPDTGAQLDRQWTMYNQYQQTGVLQIDIVDIVDTGACTIPIIKTADAITIFVGEDEITTIGKDPNSHDFSTTVGDVDEVTIVKKAVTTDNVTGVYYSIKNLG